MSIFEILKADHKKVKTILNKLQKMEDESTRDELFSQFKREIFPHLKAEESVMYPRLREEEEIHENALEAIEEHSVAEYMIRQLDETAMDDETWGAKCKVLKELVEHHIEEEEAEIFKKMRKSFNRNELAEMGREINDFKSSFKMRGLRSASARAAS